MKYSKLMKERSPRVSVLLRELGFEMLDGELLEETYSADSKATTAFRVAVYIDRDSKFLELAYTFSFSSNLADFVQGKLEEMMQICYEYGCYSRSRAPRKRSPSPFSPRSTSRPQLLRSQGNGP